MTQKGLPVRQAGQIILIIILIMATALGVGLAVVQRSLTDISTSTKVEQSTRAFSAAEAGIERAIRTPQGSQSFGVGTASVNVTSSPLLPDVASRALEYPPISKEELAQVWLDPGYTNSNFDVYFGTANTNDKPAIEITVVSWDGVGYVPTKKFFDSDSTRASSNGFTSITCNNPSIRTNSNSTDSQFYCKANVTGYPYTAPKKPILTRIRLLYSSTSHPVAVAPTGGGSLPPQARIFTSTGTAGDTQRKVQVFKLDKVVPFYFDYALFSAGSIEKQ